MITINVMTKKLKNLLLAKRWYAQNPEKAKAARSRYQSGHMADHSKSNVEWRKRNPEQWAIINRRCNLKRCGWTPERVEVFKTTQNNLCAICEMPFDVASMQATGVHADHEHVVPPKPRGLLCGLCNKGLGQFKDDPIRLEKAIKYLRKWGK